MCVCLCVALAFTITSLLSAMKMREGERERKRSFAIKQHFDHVVIISNMLLSLKQHILWNIAETISLISHLIIHFSLGKSDHTHKSGAKKYYNKGHNN